MTLMTLIFTNKKHPPTPLNGGIEICEICGLFFFVASWLRGYKLFRLRRGEKITADRLKAANIWGKSVKYDGQEVGLDQLIEDGDMIYLN